MSIRPLPLQFLQSISVSATNVVTSATIQSSSHPYPYLYTVTVENGQSGSLNLYQTRSASWKAIQVSQTDLNLPSWAISALAPIVAPFLPKLAQGNESLWHNSWTLPNGRSSLILVYLPQYLEFFGIALLVMMPVLALVAIVLYKKIIQKK